LALPVAAQSLDRSATPVMTAQIQIRAIHIQTAAGTSGNQTHTKRNCRCRNYGTYFKLGQVACIKTPNGPRLARCSMTLNNTVWEFLSDGCPTARLSPSPPPGLSRIAVFMPTEE